MRERDRIRVRDSIDLIIKGLVEQGIDVYALDGDTLATICPVCPGGMMRPKSLQISRRFGFVKCECDCVCGTAGTKDDKGGHYSCICGDADLGCGCDPSRVGDQWGREGQFVFLHGGKVVLHMSRVELSDEVAKMIIVP